MGNQRVIQSKTVEATRQRSSAIAPKPPFTTRPGVHPLLQMQRQIGNQAVNRLIQAKLKVGKPNDTYEQEADRTADTVMRMPDPLIQRQEEEKTEETAQAKPLVGTISPLVQRQADEKEETAQAKLLIEPITPLVQRQPQEEKKDETAQMLQRQAADENKDETAQAKGTADATPEVAPNLESRIQTMRGGGQPLANSTRTFFESRFGYDFGGVRVHTDSQAAETASHLNAQAFTIGRNIFFGAGRYEPHTTSGQWLLAHELTHTVQQSPQPLTATSRVVQSHPDPGAQSSQLLQRQAPEEEKPETIQTKAETAIALSTSGNQVGAITQPQSVTVSPAPTQVQGIFGIEIPGIDTVLNWAAERAANIPGFTLLTVILGRNPINNQLVARNAVNLIRGIMGLVPGGELLFQGLQASGAIDRVATWLEQQIDQLNITWEGIVALFTRALNSLSARDILDLRGAGERVLNIFRPTLDRIRALAASVGSRVIQFIKEAILRPVGQFAQRLPFYPLLTVILGKNPITDEEVDRSPTNVIRGILLIIPGGEEKFQQLQQSGVLDRAFAWFNEQLARLNLTWNSIKALFARAWEVLGIQDLLSPSAAFNKIQTIFGEPVQRITTFAGAAIRKVAEFIFEGVLTLAGGLGRQVLNLFNRARGVLSNIIENPIGFVGNLVGAVKRGFQQFSSNILTHLQAGLIGWLFGALAGAGLQLPERFDLRGIVSLVMQILGFTYQRLRGILVRLLGSEERVQRAEQIFDFLVTLVRDGIAAAWERIVEFAGNLQEMVLGGIRDWVARTVVGQAIARLVTLFNPAGAVIQAIMAIYNTVVFFIERAQQIGVLVEAVFGSIASIAVGNIGAAANYVERTMARTIPVILGFLARFIGLGNVSEQIQNVVRRIQAPIENAMNRVADWIVAQVRRLGRAVLGGGADSGERTERTSTLERPVGFAGEGHRLRAVAGDGSSAILMASNGFIDLGDQLALLRQNYLGQRGHLTQTGQSATAGQAAQELDERLRRIVRRKNEILQQANRNRDQRTQILSDGLDELDDMVIELGEYMTETFGETLGAGSQAQVGSVIYVVSADRGFIVSDIRVIRQGHFGIQARSLDRSQEVFLSYVSHGQDWRIPSVQQPPPYAGFSGGQGTGMRQVRNTQRGVTGQDPFVDPPGYSPLGHWNRRGHLVAKEFGGPGDLKNIVAMTRVTNHESVGMRSIEIDASRDIGKGCVLTYKATPIYNGKSPFTSPPDAIEIVVDEEWPNQESSKHSKRVDNTL